MSLQAEWFFLSPLCYGLDDFLVYGSDSGFGTLFEKKIRGPRCALFMILTEKHNPGPKTQNQTVEKERQQRQSDESALRL